MFAATPALAQNDTAATDNAVADNAMVATDMNAAAPADANAMTAMPPATTETTTMDTNVVEPAPAPKRGFPWGILGLLGLIGLLPRTRRPKRG